MKCENCNKKHDGIYGSGRFCSKECARGFSTKNKRKEINEKVSNKLSGRKQNKNQKRYKFTKDDCVKGGGWNKLSKQQIINGEFKGHSNTLKQRLIKEGILEDKCCQCGWNKKRPGFKFSACHLDHIDGDTTNNKLSNLRILCPNCHALTETYAIQKHRRNKAS